MVCLGVGGIVWVNLDTVTIHTNHHTHRVTHTDGVSLTRGRLFQFLCSRCSLTRSLNPGFATGHLLTLFLDLRLFPTRTCSTQILRYFLLGLWVQVGDRHELLKLLIDFWISQLFVSKPSTYRCLGGYAQAVKEPRYSKCVGECGRGRRSRNRNIFTTVCCVKRNAVVSLFSCLIHNICHRGRFI